MLTAVLPLYFMLELRLTPLQFGLIDGLYQGASAVIRVAAGAFADARGQYKRVAFIGYALSTLCRVGLLASKGWAGVTAFLMVDRLGKGIRTAPRDAIITLSSDRSRLGEAFGVHRTLDTVGAVVGPVIAFAVLAVSARAYDAVFVVSLAFSAIGLAIIGLFVEDRTPGAPATLPAQRPRVRAVLSHTGFRRLLGAGLLVSACTASDALIYLMLQRSGAVPATVFPLLFVGTATVYLVMAYPLGRLADRWGRSRLFLAGHLAIAAIYAVVGPVGLSGTAAVVTAIALLGLYYAATDGVLAALAGGVLQTTELTTGLALVSTGVAVARLVAAAAFGASWSWFGQQTTLTAFLLLTLLAVGLAAWLLGDRVEGSSTRSTSAS